LLLGSAGAPGYPTRHIAGLRLADSAQLSHAPADPLGRLARPRRGHVLPEAFNAKG
jgi:hypothetical protein